LQDIHVALWLNIEFDNEIDPFTSENFPTYCLTNTLNHT